MLRSAWLLIILTSVLLTGCNLASAPAPPTETAVPPQLDLTCDQLVSTAIQSVGPICNTTGRNEACYGNNQVMAELQEGAQANFDAVGDLAALQDISLITTSPLNEALQTWGVALLKAQVNLPDNLPGQNVTFLLYGGAALDQVTADMEAVILSTGIGGATCQSAPQSAALVQNPNGTEVNMNLNGASLTIGSTLHITALVDNLMTISTISGLVTVEAFGVSQVVVPGAQTTLPLGSTDGLQVVGPPSEPEPFDLDVIQRAPLELLPDLVQIPDPISTEETETFVTATLPSLPITQTLPPVTVPLPATVIPTACFPRTDWQYTYVVRSGDTLFSIATRFGLSLAQLQTGNCISNANQIFVGQVLRVPSPPPPTVPPPPTLTPTSRIGPTLQPTSTTIPFDTPTPDDGNDNNGPAVILN